MISVLRAAYDKGAALCDDAFDALTVSAAYPDFPHVGVFAREASRVLRQGGKIYIAEVYYPLF